MYQLCKFCSPNKLHCILQCISDYVIHWLGVSLSHIVCSQRGKLLNFIGEHIYFDETVTIQYIVSNQK